MGVESECGIFPTSQAMIASGRRERGQLRGNVPSAWPAGTDTAQGGAVTRMESD